MVSESRAMRCNARAARSSSADRFSARILRRATSASSAKRGLRPVSSAHVCASGSAPRRIVQQRADVVHEIVAGRAVHGPVVAQRFAARRESFRPPHTARSSRSSVRPLPQTLAIFARLGEAVDVIDPQAVHHAFLVQPERSAHARPRTLRAVPRARRRACEMSKKRRQFTSSDAVRHHARRKCCRSISRCRRSRVTGSSGGIRLQRDLDRRVAVFGRDELAQHVARLRRRAADRSGCVVSPWKRSASALRSARSALCRIDA